MIYSCIFVKVAEESLHDFLFQKCELILRVLSSPGRLVAEYQSVIIKFFYTSMPVRL